jgi:glycosyltransferase involved in cell wall biosynthesis
MKIALVYRKPHAGGYSIEELFHTIAGELRKHAEVIEYECGSRWHTLIDAWRLRSMQADIYHITGDINWLTLLLPHNKTVLTVHDIGHYLFGLNGLKRWLYKQLWLTRPMRAARAVTAVSSTTRDNIVAHLGIAGDRIRVIENCHGAVFQPDIRQFNEACPTILQVGTKPYKNVPRLAEAIKGIRCRLILIGDIDTQLAGRLNEYGIEYENLRSLSHADIYQQYKQADLVSFVSLGEGFGVPIIEAQATGRPLITANLPPMCNVAGEGACLVDPLDVSQIRTGILRIIADAEYRKKLVERGLRNAARYSPATIGARYYDLYKELSRP